jgi:hypothetical protein
MVRAKPDPGKQDSDRVNVEVAYGAERYAVVLVCAPGRRRTGLRPASPGKVGDVEAAIAAEVEARWSYDRLTVDVL